MQALRFHIIQHVSFEGPGYIAEWIENQHFPMSFTSFFNNEPLPTHNCYDVLIIMGGPMGVYDHNEYPWLEQEKKFIAEAIKYLARKVRGWFR